MPKLLRQIQLKGPDGRVRRYASPSYVYFILQRPRGVIKIGFTSCCPFDRFDQISKNAPPGTKLVLLGVIEVFDKSEEAALHKRFSEWRDRGEWFWCSQEISGFIKREVRAHLCDAPCRARTVLVRTAV